MANISHKNLTSNQIHEPKGADTATANKVYVSNGSGSGTWKKIEADNMEASAKPFANQLLFVSQELPAGSAAENITAGSWQILNLNTTKVNQIAGASLSANTVTLPAGTYFFSAILCNPNSTGHGKSRLWNSTGNATLATSFRSIGYVVGSVSGWEYQYPVVFNGTFTLSATSGIQLQTYLSNSATNNQTVSGTSEPNVYRTMAIWKIA